MIRIEKTLKYRSLKFLLLDVQNLFLSFSGKLKFLSCWNF